MANKSVIDVEINDESFKEFYELYKQYEDDLGKMPEEWAKVSEASKESVKEFGDAIGMWVEANRSSEGASRATVTNIDRATTAQRQFTNAAKDSGKQMDKIDKTAKSISHSIFGIGKFLLGSFSLAGLSGIVGTIGGLFGMDKLATSAVSNQRSALGLGLTTGQYRAFQTDLGRYLDPGILSSVANAQNSYEGRVWLARASGMGVNQVMSTGAGDISAQLAIRAHDWWKNTPEAQRTDANLAATGFTQAGLSLTDVRRLGNSDRGQLVSAAEQYRTDSKSLDISGRNTNALYDFNRQLELAGQNLSTYFTKKLADLGPSLGKFITNLEKDAEILLNGILTPKNLESVQHGFETVAEYLGSQEFRDDARRFADGLKQLSEAVGWLLDKLPGVKTLVNPPANSTTAKVYRGLDYMRDLDLKMIHGIGTVLGKGADNVSSIYDKVTGKKEDKYASTIASLESAKKLPAGLLGATAQVESSWNPKAVSPVGAQGLMQLMPATAKGLGVSDPFDPEQSLKGGADLYEYLLNRYNGDIKKAVAAYNWNPNALDRDIKQHGEDWEKYAPTETQNQIRKVLSLMQKSQKVKIDITNRAGANVAVSANAAGI